jgi:hypothetical protein
LVAVASLIVVLFLSLLVVRVAAEALVLTGLSREAARFQARSAWTGTGFTTQESEMVVSHPVRRQIVSSLMLLRSAGLVTAASTLMLSFAAVEERDQGLLRLVVIAGGLVSLWFVARSSWVERWMARAIAAALKRTTDLDTRDYAGLLHLAGEYAVMELKLREGSWLAGRALAEIHLPEEGVLVLGVSRPDGAYVGAPHGSMVVRAGDTLLLYGRSPRLAELGSRRADTDGEHRRREATDEEQREKRAERS